MRVAITGRRRFIAIFLLLVFLLETTTTTVSYALTSGPTAPEATSFEPVDTTDMVNLATGDFTYGMPLLEVPGPAGGYPLSLSYHAGIQPNEDASWVGLGWTLNPGSLTRLVNGYADDLDGATVADRTFWEGGETTTYTVGVSVGIGDAASVSAGLSFSQDTYQGFGMGAYLGGSISFFGKNHADGRNGGPLGVSGTVGISPYGGGAYASGGVGLSYGQSVGNIQGSLTAALSANTQEGVSAGISGGVSYKRPERDKDGIKEKDTRGWSLLDATIASTGSKPSLSVGGGSAGVSNSKTGKISTHSDNFSIDIPILPCLGISLGRSVVRYWSDETETMALYGSLFMHDQVVTDTKGFDSYSSFSGALAAANGLSTDEQLGPTYADYDQYMVSAQGVSGTIRPYHYQVTVNRQNNKPYNEPYKVKMYTMPQLYPTNKVEYHFVNDFSNRVTNNPQALEIGNADFPLLSPFFLTTTGFNDGHGIPNVPGSKHVEYFTNADMTTYRSMTIARGFLDCEAAGFERNVSPGTALVGGFRITNSSGVTYHFSLPVYSYDEHTYTENRNHSTGDSFNHLKNPNRYAYTWYLTAMTGPDFVDRNADGFASEGDWGYWVSFQYGKWADKYQWRNPGEGFNEDGDVKFRSYSKGKKELYFLNKIKTQTHTALFVKEIRLDAKGSTSLREDAVLTNSDHRISYVDEGGYAPKQRPCANITTYTHYPVSQLKLKSIYLLKNSDVPNNLESAASVYSHTIYCSPPYNPVVYHTGDNVVDVHDFNVHQTQIKSNSIRSISFNTDYSLASGLPNSYASPIDVMNTPSKPNYALKGKLTLNNIEFFGKAGVSLMPPTKFHYELENQVSKNGGVLYRDEPKKFADIHFNGVNPFQQGDIVSYMIGPTKSFAYVKAVLGGGIRIRPLLDQILPPLGSNVSSVQKTKNPPYHKEMYDIWSCYKSDMSSPSVSFNARLTTPTSAKNVDVWSLRSIETDLGSKITIEYEPDGYDKSYYSRNWSVGLSFDIKKSDSNGDPLNPPLVRMVAYTGEETEFPFTNYFHVGQPVNMVAIYSSYNGYYTTPYSKSGGIVISVTPTSIVLDPQIPYVFGNIYHKGSLYLTNSFNIGGGIRVKSIGLSEAITLKKSETTYEYLEGATSFEPVTSPEYELNAGGANAAVVNKFYKQIMLSGYIDLLTIGRDLPAPGVLYGKVNIREIFTDEVGAVHPVPGYSQYAFRPYQYGFVTQQASSGTPVTQSGTSQGINYTSVEVGNGKLQNFTQAVGELMSITLFDDNGRKLNETINHYLIDQEATLATFDTQGYIDLLADLNNQGVIHEVFNHGKFVKQTNGSYRVMGIRSKKETYPSVQTGSTTINYKTGIKTTSQNVKFDFYSGEVLSTVTTDGLGNTFLAETTPAYEVYQKMGPKDHLQFDTGPDHKGFNKHMLTQVASSASYKVDESSLNKLGVIAATASTWSNLVPVLEATSQIEIWRKKSEFSFVSSSAVGIQADGILPIGSFVEFDAWAPNDVVPEGWQKNSEITLYDPNSHALEATDLYGKYAATKMSLDHSVILSTAANADYNEYAYSGAEENITTPGTYGGGAFINGSKVGQAHTGASGVSAGLNNRAFTYNITPKLRSYIVSVWSMQNDANIKYKVGAGSPILLTTELVGKAGSWYLLEAKVDASDTWPNLEVWCESKLGTTVFDDFRVHPFDAVAISYVYNSWGELSHILDAQNLFTEFQYDGMGRLVRTYREVFDPANSVGKTKVTEQEYNYGINGKRLEAQVALQTAQTILATVTFGHGPFHYKWYANNVLKQEGDSPLPTSTFTSTETCPHLVRCEITDDHEGSRILEITAGGENLGAQFTGPDPQQFLQTSTQYTFVNPFVGSCGPYTIQWSIGHLAGPFMTVGGGPTLNYSFSTCGNYRVTCTIQKTDGIGPMETSSLDYYVTGGQGCIEY